MKQNLVGVFMTGHKAVYAHRSCKEVSHKIMKYDLKEPLSLYTIHKRHKYIFMSKTYYIFSYERYIIFI